MKKILFLLSAIILLAISCNPAAPVTSSLPGQSGRAYENQYLKITIINGWTVRQAPVLYYPSDSGKGIKTAINITKGKYILYINPTAQQASGVEGGRFAEIAQGSPSVDAVVITQPSDPCSKPDTTAIGGNYSRMDYFVERTDKSDVCNAPSDDKNVWYFSYVTSPDPGALGNGFGYFNYYENNQPLAMVATMSYNSKDIDSFPQKGSLDFSQALDEMTQMINSLQLKLR